MTDPRAIAFDDEDDEFLDPRHHVWEEDDEDLGNGGTGGGSVTTNPIPGSPEEAFPILLPDGINASPGDRNFVAVRWSVSAAQLTEGPLGNLLSSRVFNAQIVGLGPSGVVQRTFPVDLVCVARVTGGTASASDYDLASLHTTSSTTEVLLRFPAGSSSAGVRVWAKDAGGVESTETLELTLETTNIPVFPIDGGAPFVVTTSPLAGPAVLTVSIIDSAPAGTPEWRWAIGTSDERLETEGPIIYEIALDGPSTTDVTITFTSAPGSPAAVPASPGVTGNYVNLVAPNNRVTIPAGQTTGQLTFVIINNPASVVGPNLEVEITGVVTAGFCTDPTADTLTIEIVDDDLTAPARTVQFASASLVYDEPTDPANEMTHVLFVTVNQPFATRTDCPFTITNTNTALGVGYNVSGGQGVPALRVRFEPNATQGYLRFRPIANGIIGDAAVLLTLTDGGTLYGLGTNDTLNIVIRENSSGLLEQTFFAGPRGIKTGRSIMEATCAVVPPSETLPTYHNVATGETCQTVGMARDSRGRWDAVRVLTVAAGDIGTLSLNGNQTSYPGHPTGTPVEIDLGEGANGMPAESGVMTAVDFTGLVCSIVPANTGLSEYKRALSDNLADATTAIPPTWVGPSDAMFPQVGADLVRTEYYRTTLRLDGDTSEDSETGLDPDVRCMSVELWLKRRADVDVVEVEGVLTNTNWDKKVDPRTGSRDRVSGVVNLFKFEIQDVPAGWAATWSTANPNESFAGSTITLLPDRDNGVDPVPYEFSPCATMPFRFALYRTATSSAAEAQRVLRYRGLGVSTGHYGVTRNNCWGVMGDKLMDPRRAGYSATWGVTAYDGWRAMEETGQQFVAAWSRASWAAGTAAGSPSSPRLDARYGWMQSAHARGAGESGGSGINGQTAILPSVGYWEDSWYAIAASIMRQRAGMKDVLSGDECWQQVLVEEAAAQSYPNSVPAGRAPIVQACNQRLGMHRLPHFNTTNLTSGAVWTSLPALYHTMGSTNAVWCRAPTTRPWNTDEGVPDPDHARVCHELPSSVGGAPAAYQHQDSQHSARYREQIEDAWWGCWSPLAWWQSMHVGAYITRGQSAHLVDPAWFTGVGVGGGQRFTPYEEHVGFIVAEAAAGGGPLEKGRPYLPNNGFTAWWWPLGNMRGFGHGATLVAQAYAIGGDRQRAKIVVPGGVNWFSEWAKFVTRFSTPAGHFSVTDAENINPHVEAFWGPRNVAARTGAVSRLEPPASGPLVPPEIMHQHLAMLSHHFVVFGAWAVFWRAIRSNDSTLQLGIRKLLRSGYNIREANRVWTSAQGLAPLGPMAVTARGDYWNDPAGHPNVPDVATYIADYGHDFGSGNGHNEDCRNATAYHAPKHGMCVYAWREARLAEDPAQDLQLTPALCFFYVPNETEFDYQDALDNSYARVLAATNAGNSGNVQALNIHTDLSFMYAFTAEMLDLVT